MEHITEFCSLSLYTISAPKEGLPAWPHHRSFPAVRSAGRPSQIVLSRSFCKTVLRLTSHVEVGRVRPPCRGRASRTLFADVGPGRPLHRGRASRTPSAGVGRAGPFVAGVGRVRPPLQGSGERPAVPPRCTHNLDTGGRARLFHNLDRSIIFQLPLSERTLDSVSALLLFSNTDEFFF